MNIATLNPMPLVVTGLSGSRNHSRMNFPGATPRIDPSLFAFGGSEFAVSPRLFSRKVPVGSDFSLVCLLV